MSRLNSLTGLVSFVVVLKPCNQVGDRTSIACALIASGAAAAAAAICCGARHGPVTVGHLIEQLCDRSLIR